MFYTPDKINKLIEGLLPALREAHTEQRVSMKRPGSYIIANGKTFTDSGHPVIPDQIYPVFETKKTPVNHRANMEAIIKKAKKEPAMQNQLAAYVSKYAKNKEALRTK